MNYDRVWMELFHFLGSHSCACHGVSVESQSSKQGPEINSFFIKSSCKFHCEMNKSGSLRSMTSEVFDLYNYYRNKTIVSPCDKYLICGNENHCEKDDVQITDCESEHD